MHTFAKLTIYSQLVAHVADPPKSHGLGRPGMSNDGLWIIDRTRPPGRGGHLGWGLVTFESDKSTY
jgi:hypothetical protein